MDHLLNIQDARKYFLPRNEKFANRTANVLADIPPEEPQPLESVGKQGMFALCYTDKALDKYYTKGIYCACGWKK